MMLQNCTSCMHFHNCSMDGIDAHSYCSTDPEAIGVCDLWDGARKTIKACSGWENPSIQLS
ncbi:hypothetical protein [Candidatus Lokiarchaeum ossiferum]|uniref:hypothetical protein n=1 Tax=Candidatus Lokiarchaeum ossiferum TaxID=2951803 RepID=UPI00352FBBBE